MRDGRLHVSPVKATTPPEADALADRIDAMLPHARIIEVMHEVSRATGFAAAFTNLRTGERCDNENALLATILADASNLGLTRMAAVEKFFEIQVNHDAVAFGNVSLRLGHRLMGRARPARASPVTS